MTNHRDMDARDLADAVIRTSVRHSTLLLSTVENKWAASLHADLRYSDMDERHHTGYLVKWGTSGKGLESEGELELGSGVDFLMAVKLYQYLLALLATQRALDNPNGIHGDLIRRLVEL